MRHSLLIFVASLACVMQVSARRLAWSEPVPVDHFNVYFTRDISLPVRQWTVIDSPTDPIADMPFDGPCGYFTVSAVSASGEEVFTQANVEQQVAQEKANLEQFKDSPELTTGIQSRIADLQQRQFGTPVVEPELPSAKSHRTATKLLPPKLHV